MRLFVVQPEDAPSWYADMRTALEGARGEDLLEVVAAADLLPILGAAGGPCGVVLYWAASSAPIRIADIREEGARRDVPVVVAGDGDVRDVAREPGGLSAFSDGTRYVQFPYDGDRDAARRMADEIWRWARRGHYKVAEGDPFLAGVGQLRFLEDEHALRDFAGVAHVAIEAARRTGRVDHVERLRELSRFHSASGVVPDRRRSEYVLRVLARTALAPASGVHSTRKQRWLLVDDHFEPWMHACSGLIQDVVPLERTAPGITRADVREIVAAVRREILSSPVDGLLLGLRLSPMEPGELTARTGVRVAELLRHGDAISQGNSTTPIVWMTGATDPDVTGLARSFWCRYLRKPLTAREATEMVSTLWKWTDDAFPERHTLAARSSLEHLARRATKAARMKLGTKSISLRGMARYVDDAVALWTSAVCHDDLPAPFLEVLRRNVAIALGAAVETVLQEMCSPSVGLVTKGKNGYQLIGKPDPRSATIFDGRVYGRPKQAALRSVYQWRNSAAHPNNAPTPVVLSDAELNQIARQLVDVFHPLVP